MVTGIILLTQCALSIDDSCMARLYEMFKVQKDRKLVEFVLECKGSDDIDVSLDTIGFSDFNKFCEQVQRLVVGSDGFTLDDAQFELQNGSLRIILYLSMAAYSLFSNDLKQIGDDYLLNALDSKRAEQLVEWQKSANVQEKMFSVKIDPHDEEIKPIILNSKTAYRVYAPDIWFPIEEYMLGTIVNMGGAIKANIHFRTETNEKIILVKTTHKAIEDIEENRIYKQCLIRVRALQNATSKEKKEYELVEFIDYKPIFNGEEFSRMVENGSKVWYDVKDAEKWVRDIRDGGNNG